MGDIEQLMEMGFPQDKIEYALRVTNNTGLEAAMDWLLAHADEDLPRIENNPMQNATELETNIASENQTKKTDTSSSAISTATPVESDLTSTESPKEETEELGKSFKCDECGKIMKDIAETEYHAVRTKHTNFSSSKEEKKPLTEEEKREQLDMVEKILREKRIEREERERLDAIEQERNRIRSGKDMIEAKKRLEQLEMEKIVQQRKRKKAEVMAACKRVRIQLQADKDARKAKEGTASVKTDTICTTSVSPKKLDSCPIPSSIEYTETRIQIRLIDGSTVSQKFNVKEPLSAVRLFVQSKSGISDNFTLMTNFPRKVFTDDDYDKPLNALGLAPSATLILTKR